MQTHLPVLLTQAGFVALLTPPLSMIVIIRVIFHLAITLAPGSQAGFMLVEAALIISVIVITPAICLCLPIQLRMYTGWAI